ncbi:hypothetical protein F5146DRAFT_1139774 [Armillaria mellea]|nr:hypothetical protein F5146DRAFT_1139774 [Armillaria mellea]
MDIGSSHGTISHDFLSAAQTMLYGDLDMQDVQNPNTLQSAVLARMDNLCSLSLPSLDLHSVCHHYAFGLCYLEFWNACLSEQAQAEFLMWLNGQTNVVSLHFLFLTDGDNNGSSLVTTDVASHHACTYLPFLCSL